jgi:pimeloyl-ACP methyl ester carboxylesterase
VIDGVGHGVNWEAPEAFNRRCLEFLASVDTP